MDRPDSFARSLAQRLLASGDADLSRHEVYSLQLDEISEKLRLALSSSVGADGFTALLRRALTLAQKECEVLRPVTVASDGRLEGSRSLDISAQVYQEAALVLSTHVLHLLVTFVGESITLHMLRDLWPEVSRVESTNKLRSAHE